MVDIALLTAEQFADSKYDLPEGGRWVELVDGKLVTLQPPDEIHGTTVLNLSKAIAEYVGQSIKAETGYACFELGLVVARDPDTVRCPAISWFTGGELFAEADKPITETQPALVVEVASTNDRRRETARRVEQYLAWGVELVWVIDPIDRQVLVWRRGRPPRQYSARESLVGSPVLPNFGIRVEDLFAEPKWWRGKADRR